MASKGARVEPWLEGSNAFPPRGLRATDYDALVTDEVLTYLLITYYLLAYFLTHY